MLKSYFLRIIKKKKTNYLICIYNIMNNDDEKFIQLILFSIDKNYKVN